MITIPAWLVSALFFGGSVGAIVGLIIWLALGDGGEEDE